MAPSVATGIYVYAHVHAIKEPLLSPSQLSLLQERLELLFGKAKCRAKGLLVQGHIHDAGGSFADA